MGLLSQAFKKTKFSSPTTTPKHGSRQVRSSKKNNICSNLIGNVKLPNFLNFFTSTTQGISFSGFRKGCGCIISEFNWLKYPATQGFLGRSEKKQEDSGQFVAPLQDLAAMIEQAKDWHEVERHLGLPFASLVGGRILLASVFEPLGLRLPTRTSGGANEYFVEGGKTSSGIPEAFVSLTPLTTTLVLSDGQLTTFRNVAVQVVEPGEKIIPAYTGPLAQEISLD